jgi:hypothetical protein
MTIPDHTAALHGALARWEAGRPGAQTEVAAALRATLADGWAVVQPLAGPPFLVLARPGHPPAPARLLTIAGLPALPLPEPDAPAQVAAAPSPLAADGPLTGDEMAALSRQGWNLAGDPGATLVRMAATHEDGWPTESRTPGGWRALL